MAQTIAVLSQKGGTGKTTTVRTLTDVFRRVGLDVLAVDLDPQGNLSDYFDVDAEADADGRRRARRRAKAKAAVHDGHHPGQPRPGRGRAGAAGKMGRELILRKALKDVAQAATTSILIDCPPALGLLTVNALVAADWALLTAEAQYFALQGVEQALEVIELARDGLNPDLEWLGVVFNIADMRTVHSREAYDVAQGALRRQAASRRRSASRSPTPSPPSGRSRSSTTAPTSARTTSRWPTSCSGALGLTAAREQLEPLLAGRGRRRLTGRPAAPASTAAVAARGPRADRSAAAARGEPVPMAAAARPGRAARAPAGRSTAAPVAGVRAPRAAPARSRGRATPRGARRPGGATGRASPRRGRRGDARTARPRAHAVTATSAPALRQPAGHQVQLGADGDQTYRRWRAPPSDRDGPTSRGAPRGASDLRGADVRAQANVRAGVRVRRHGCRVTVKLGRTPAALRPGSNVSRRRRRPSLGRSRRRRRLPRRAPTRLPPRSTRRGSRARRRRPAIPPAGWRRRAAVDAARRGTVRPARRRTPAPPLRG